MFRKPLLHRKHVGLKWAAGKFDRDEVYATLHKDEKLQEEEESESESGSDVDSRTVVNLSSEEENSTVETENEKEIQKSSARHKPQRIKSRSLNGLGSTMSDMDTDGTGEVSESTTRDAGFETDLVDDPEDESDDEDGHESRKAKYIGIYTSVGVHNRYRVFDRVKHKLEELPQAATPLRITVDSPSTVALIKTGRRGRITISEHTKRILTKNNSPHFRNLSFPDYNFDRPRNDVSFTQGVRQMHTYLINDIVHRAMLDENFPLAFRAFALLLRRPSLDFRIIWTIGLELLVWRRERREAGLMSARNEEILPMGTEFDTETRMPNNGTAHTSSPEFTTKVEDEDFLQWLVVLFPSKPVANFFKNSSRTIYQSDLYPHLFWTRMRHSRPRQALDQLEDLILELPHSENPIYHAQCGIATIQLACEEKAGENNSQRLETLSKKAATHFKNCLKYGGVFPEDFIKMELNNIVE